MALPMMKSGTGNVHGVYKLAQYDCILVEKPEAISPIKYFFMLIVSEKDIKSPKFVVTCEYNSLQNDFLKLAGLPNLGNPPAAYLCYFDENGNHFINAPLNEIPTVDSFKSSAFEIVKLKLNISENPVLVNSVKQPKSLIEFNLVRFAARGINLIWQLKDKINLNFVLMSVIILLIVMLASNINKPKTYNDCILEGMKGIASNLAVREVTNACKSKFGKKVKKKILTFREIKINLPSDASEQEVSRFLAEEYGATRQEISEALSTIYEETTYELK